MSTPQPDSLVDHRLARLEAETERLRKKCTELTVSTWVFGILVLALVVFPLAFRYATQFIDSLDMM